MDASHIGHDTLIQFKIRLEKLCQRITDTMDEVSLQARSKMDYGPTISGRYVECLEQTHLRICKALERIVNTEYGICLDCRNRIQLERLNNLPYAEFCYECQQRHERSSRLNE